MTESKIYRGGILFDPFYENKHLIIALKDDPKEPNKDCRIIKAEECFKYNDLKYGIFFTVQGFASDKRVKENCCKINAWAIDMDEGTKEEQKARLDRSPLVPSVIIESKNGYHVYWVAQKATFENFDEIQKRLVHHFQADKNAKDLCRMLRLPPFFHWKDVDDPFLVQVVWEDERALYDDEMMLRYFAAVPEKKFSPHRDKKFVELQPQGTIFEQLSALSGDSCVGGDVFSFHRNTNGTHQIWSNNKSTGAWIDLNGYIGSHKQAGPTILQWLKYYNYSTKEAIEILKRKNIYKEEDHA